MSEQQFFVLDSQKAAARVSEALADGWRVVQFQLAGAGTGGGSLGGHKEFLVAVLLERMRPGDEAYARWLVEQGR